jgi:hypothetical protein
VVGLNNIWGFQVDGGDYGGIVGFVRALTWRGRVSQPFTEEFWIAGVDNARNLCTYQHQTEDVAARIRYVERGCLKRIRLCFVKKVENEAESLNNITSELLLLGK